jgi:hypothetical protein
MWRCPTESRESSEVYHFLNPIFSLDSPMPRSLPLLVAVFLAVPAIADDKFTPLFNGKDTTGWTFTLRAAKPDDKPDPKGTWSVKDGLLVCTGKPNGYIATEKEYENYVLRLKWRYPKNAEKPNSGVLLHCTSKDQVWPHSVEAQLKSGFAGDFWLNADQDGKLPEIQHDRKDLADKNHRHYLRVEMKESVEKPLGEWNAMEITCQGGEIVVMVNGVKVNNAKGCSLRKGRIALQSEGSAVEFQEIEIKR